MSITTSLLNFCLNSIAILAQWTTASGSSPLQWRIGASTIFPKSDGYGLDLANLGLVVKPIWLFTIIWIVPPVLWPFKPDIAKHSATTPCPANAASPWISNGITFFLSESLWKYCFALVWPRTTGLTASKCEGLSVRLTCTEFPSKVLSDEAPKWYFTSPVESSLEAANSPANSLKILL